MIYQASSKASPTRLVPDSFKDLLRAVSNHIAEKAPEEQLRSIALDSNGNPVIQVRTRSRKVKRCY